MVKKNKENNAKFATKTAGRYIAKIFQYFFNIVLTLLLVCIITGAIMGTAFIIYIKNYIDPEYDIENLQFNLNMTTSMYYQDVDESGNDIWVEMEGDRIHGSENRLWVDYDQIPSNLVNAFVAIEDKRFFSHNGVDLKRTAGAIIGFISGNDHYGGSTITQQLIKNVSGDDEVTVQRKIQEILRAINLEKKKDKKEILEMYLNTIYLSQGCNGVQTAANEYFGKDVSDLTLVECAALAAIPQYPTKWDPRQHPDQNKERRDVILSEMYNQGYITLEERDEAFNTELVLYNEEDDGTTYTETIHSYYIDAVMDEVIADLQTTLNIDRTVATQMLYSGGLQIHTNLDPEVQKILEDCYEDDSNFPKISSGGVQPESAMTIVDNSTGYVVALVGGRGEKTTSRGINRATQSKRQPGSSIKPLAVYSQAIEEGIINYGSTVSDTAFTVLSSTKKPWPANYPVGYEGNVSVCYALQVSKNTCAVKVLDELTPEKSFEFMTDKFKFTTLIDSYTDSNGNVFSDIGLSQLALGGLTYGVTTEEMAAAYATFPRHGSFVEATTYREVLDNQGNVILSNVDSEETVLSAETCDIMTKLLQNVVAKGTARKLTLKDKVQVAAKTGTTTSTKDLFFAGYTPYYTAVSWFGYDIPRDLGKFSTSPALDIWDTVMTKIHQKYIDSGNVKKFEISDNVKAVKYCSKTGKLPSSGCDYVETGYFTEDNMPEGRCELKHSSGKTDETDPEETTTTVKEEETTTASSKTTSTTVATTTTTTTTQAPTEPVTEPTTEATTTPTTAPTAPVDPIPIE